MRFLFTVLLGVLPLALPSFAMPQSMPTAEYGIFEKMVEVPEGWVELPFPVDDSQELFMKIHLKQQNMDTFKSELVKRSSPRSANYGQHLKGEQVKMMLAPAESTVSLVTSWLERNGLKERAQVDSDWVMLPMTVAEAEELFQTKYHYYENVNDGRTVLRTLSVSLPNNLLDEITLVQPTTMFGFRKMKSTIKSIEPVEAGTVTSQGTNDDGSAPASCNTTVTPTCLADLYSFADYEPAGLGSVFVSGFLEQVAQFSDLETFLAKYAPDKVGANFTITSVNGGNTTQFGRSGDPNNVAEADLDIQYTVGLNSPVPNTFISVGGRPPFIPDLDESTDSNEPYLDYLNFLTDLSDDELPGVVTTSYGESEQTVPLSYRLTTCDMFAQLTSRGVTFLFSSGDEGPGASCKTNDGTNTTRFLPTYPAACPYVTAVGGTVNIEPEAAVDFSSGGFSDTWARPDYQDEAVQAFLDNHPEAWEQFADFFNQSGRAFPDVAALGLNFRVILIGSDFSIGGTSASAPTFAAVISLVNDFRLQNGKSVLGFLNPLIYENTDAFTDITTGTSTGCDGSIAGSGFVPNAGWAAVEGWDASTGLGTPIFTKLIELD